MSAGTMPAKLATHSQDQSTATFQTTGGLKWYFGFFFVSGFCSLLYELVWLRLAMAQFGVTTPMISLVLSSFMAGLGIGSWAGGRLVRKYAGRLSVPPLQLYAVAEMLIGCSAVVVPLELLAGRFVLEHLGSSLSLSSAGYYVAAGNLGRMHTDSVVCVHGSYDSARDVRNSQSAPRRISTLLQFSLPCECTRRTGRYSDPASVDRTLGIQPDITVRHAAECHHLCRSVSNQQKEFFPGCGCTSGTF